MDADQDTQGLRAAIRSLHASKSAAYGNAWKKRGELLSVLSNIARKIDRLEVWTTETATVAEPAFDTAVDLLIYCIKYQTWLSDADASAHAQVFGDDAVVNASDGLQGFDKVLSHLELARAEPKAAARAAIACFEALQASATHGMPPRSRVELAQRLTQHAGALLCGLAASSPHESDAFIAGYRAPKGSLP